MKFLFDLQDKYIKPLFEKGGKYERLYPLFEAGDTFTRTPPDVTKGSPHMRDSIDQNISNIQELGISADDLSIIRLNLSSIDTQLMLLDDTVQALNSYKNQLNQTILEIQTQINTTQSQKMSDEEEN